MSDKYKCPICGTIDDEIHAPECDGGETTPPSTANVPIEKGYLVRITIHTGDGRASLPHPQDVKDAIGSFLDHLNDGVDDAPQLQEEVDYTLEVDRFYEN